MTPLEIYKSLIFTKELLPDLQQEMLIEQFQLLYQEILISKKSSKARRKIKGIYTWGEVGRGKTRLMDIFYSSLSVPKLRLHFHPFMQYIHEKLRLFQGQPNPLRLIIKEFAKQVEVLCLDEFLILDIADAMILSNLLSVLFEEGIILIITTNIAPENLYRNGLQYSRFLPAIKLIEQHLRIINLNNGEDYRLKKSKNLNLYNYPLNEQSENQLEKYFNKLTQGEVVKHNSLFIQHRPIPTRAYGLKVLWLDFSVICSPPRAASDYIALTEQFPNLIVSNLKKILPNDYNTARLFITFIDVLYDKKINLLLSSEVSINELYDEGPFQKEFERTKSRLWEMQSPDYCNLL